MLPKYCSGPQVLKFWGGGGEWSFTEWLSYYLIVVESFPIARSCDESPGNLLVCV